MYSDLGAIFPHLQNGGYLRTSPPTVDYNCVAWVFSRIDEWWEPDIFSLCVWPNDLKRNYTINSYIKLFEKNGFTRCDNDTLETGFEKIAIYTIDNEFQHVTRQLPDGKWTSKLGDLDDITHTLRGLAGKHYGNPTIFLRRKTA